MHGGSDWAPWFYLAASGGSLLAMLSVRQRQCEGFVLLLAVAAACWSMGTALWARSGGARGVAWRLGFLVLTIAGEGWSVAHHAAPSVAALRWFAIIAAGLLLSLAGSLPLWWRAAPAGPWAVHGFGVALLALAAWLARYDVARRTVRQPGLTRYIALCLLSGYVWLAVGGAVMAGAGLAPGQPSYDAALHALLLGFVFSMVFGHAPIVFPAVLRVVLPYHPVFYAPLVLLHASLALRLLGDVSGSFALAQWGALGLGSGAGRVHRRHGQRRVSLAANRAARPPRI